MLAGWFALSKGHFDVNSESSTLQLGVHHINDYRHLAGGDVCFDIAPTVLPPHWRPRLRRGGGEQLKVG